MKSIFVIAGILCLFGCGNADLLNFDKMGKPQGWEPTYSLVLARADFSLWNAFNEGVSDSATLKKDENGRLMVEYNYSDLFNLNVDDIYSMKAEDMFFNGSFPINHSHFENGGGTALRPHYDTLAIPFKLEQLLPEVSVKEATLSIKSMSFIVVNNANIGGTLTVVCENLYSLETGDKIRIPLTLAPGVANTFYSTEVPNMKALLNGSDTVPLTFILKVDDITQMRNNQNVLIDIATTGVEYKNVNLALPSAVLPVSSGSFTPDIHFLNAFSGNFGYTQPELWLTAHTKGLGGDFSLRNLKFTILNSGQEETLETGEVFEFNGETNNLNESSSSFVYNNSNSNIRDFAALLIGGEISYKEGQLQCGGKDMWLYAGGKLALDLTLKLPLELSGADLVFYDTIRDLNLKDADKLVEARLKFEGKNGTGMELGIPEILLLDEQNTLLDRIINGQADSIFAAATGNVPAEGSIGVTFNKINLKNLADSKSIVLKIRAKSSSQENIIINESSKLDLRLRLDAKLDMGGVVFD